ncbi:MAG: hypothetical protein K0Q72_24 [Armatimonadetes bacterium]|nr:hypothetical protein [Armatimonadota bacterium]
MKTRNGAALLVGALVWVLAGCGGGSEYKESKTGGEAQMQQIKPGQPLMPPSGAPGGPAGGAPAGGGMQPPTPGQPMTPPSGAPGR